MKINNKFLKSSLVISLIAVMVVAALVVIPKAVLADDESITNLTFSAHVQDFGDDCEKGKVRVLTEVPTKDAKPEGFAGTTGECKRMEEFKIDSDKLPEGVTISYRAHVKEQGWQAWKTAGEAAGTRYQGLRMEAFQLAVTGLEGYDVYYRAHVQEQGWQDWVKALNTTDDSVAGKYPTDASVNAFAGTVGECLRMEAVEIVLVHVHDYKVAEYTFPDAEELEAGVLPEVSAKLVCPICEDEQTVTATVVEDKVAEPTCVEAGESTFTASVEGYEDAEGVVSTKTYTIKALGHKLAETHDIKWVEDEEGNPAVEVSTKCTVCNEIIKETKVAVVDEEASKAPTCVDAGYDIYVADIDGETFTKRIDVPATGHKYTPLEAKAATCVEGVKDGYAVCETCGLHFTVDNTGDEVEYTPVVDEASKPWVEPALEEGGHSFSESPVITIDEEGKDSKFSGLFSVKATETCVICGKTFDLEWINVTADKKVSGTCGTEGASVTYTITATGTEGLKATKTVTLDLSATEHVETYAHNATGHAKRCEVCGTDLNADPEVEFEDHDFEVKCLGDFPVDGEVLSKHQKVCKICGYVAVEEYCHMVPSLEGFEVGEDEHICEVCHKTQTHTYKEWAKRPNGGYTSNCSVCGNEIIKNWSDVLESIPVWATNTNGYITVTYKAGTSCTLSGAGVEAVIPEGLKLVFEDGSKLNVNGNVKVKGVVVINGEETCTVASGMSLTVDRTVDGANITGKVGGDGNLVEEVNSQTAFEEALGVANEVVVNGDVELEDELASLGEAKTVKVNAGSTMKVTGTLPTNNLKIEGEGKVELANATPATNGANLQNAVTAGAENVIVSENANTSGAVKLDGAEKELTVEIAEGKKLDSQGGAAFTVMNGGNLTISGNGETSVIDATVNTLQNVNGTLDVSHVKVEGKNGVFVQSKDSNTKLTDVVIQSTELGLSANASASPEGIGNVTLTDCNIESTGACGLYLPAGGNVTIENGTIKGLSAILDKAANLTLKGDLKLIGTGSRDEENRLSAYMASNKEGKAVQWIANGTPLLIASQKGYSDGKDVTVTIEESVTFEYTGENQNHYDIEIVGVKNVTSDSLGAKFAISYSAITDDTLETDGTKFKSENIAKKYFLDKADEFKGTISINGQTK